MKGMNPHSGMRHGAGRKRRSRRGMSVLVVLLLLSTTLALSYAVLRSQTTAIQIQDNAALRLSARQAALSGIAVGLKKMHSSADWGGVETSLSGRLTSNCTFKVDFRTGDPALTPSSPDYSDYPYRVSVVSTGTAVDPGDPNRTATYCLRTVVRLVPRNMPAEPSEWLSMTTNTVHQYSETGKVKLAVPCRIVGTIRSYGKWDFPDECKWGDTERNRYLRDLTLMALFFMGDHRPFTDQMSLPLSKQHNDVIESIKHVWPIPMDVTTSPATDWTFPGEVRTYRLYPGGKTYSVAPIPQSLGSTTLEPHQIDNPLGIHYREDDIEIGDRVTVQGTLLQNSTSGRIAFSGTEVEIKPVDLPAVYPDTRPVQIPVVMTRRDFQITAGARGRITGLVAAWRRFEVAAESQGNPCVETACRIVAHDLHICALEEWKSKSRDWWKDKNDRCMWYELFPPFVKRNGNLEYAPRIVIRPGTRSINYHYPWLNPNNPIYIPLPEDGGLRWEVVGWTENPSN